MRSRPVKRVRSAGAAMARNMSHFVADCCVLLQNGFRKGGNHMKVKTNVKAAVVWFGRVVLLATLTVPGAQAQTSKPPVVYSVTEINAMMGPVIDLKIDRDGAQAMVESTTAPQSAGAKASHGRMYYDLRTHKTYSWDLNYPTPNCSGGTFSGDWGDPFETSAGLMKELAPQNPHQAGSETVNGFATKVLETAPGPDHAKVWVESTYGLVVKAQVGSQTIIEIKRLSLVKPTASVFALPAVCASAPPTEAERIAAETGGKEGDFVDAIRAQSSPNTCPVVFRVVHAGTMTPIASGFQLAIDRTADDNSASHYTLGSTADGHMTFAGGGLREITGQLQNGAMHFPGPPAQFYLEIGLGKGGSGGALIHRQCFGSPSVLLLVVKNPEKITDGADWLWVKSGKFPSGN
jgi:hypothetical protein